MDVHLDLVVGLNLAWESTIRNMGLHVILIISCDIVKSSSQPYIVVHQTELHECYNTGHHAVWLCFWCA